MIKSISKENLLKPDPEVRAYIKQLVSQSEKENEKLVVVVNECNCLVSKYILDYVEKTRAKNVTILLRESCVRPIQGVVKYSKDKSVDFPVSLCMLVGSKSYFMTRSGDTTGFYNEPEAALLAQSIVKRVNKIFF